MNKKLSIFFLSSVFSMNAMYEAKKTVVRDRLDDVPCPSKRVVQSGQDQKMMALLKRAYYHRESQDALDQERIVKRHKQNNEQK